MLRQSFSYTVYAMAIYDVFNQIRYHGHPFSFGFYIFQFAFCGLWFGYSVWGDHEAKYKKALNPSPQISVQPH